MPRESNLFNYLMFAIVSVGLGLLIPPMVEISMYFSIPIAVVLFILCLSVFAYLEG